MIKIFLFIFKFMHLMMMMMSISTGTGLERVGVAGPDLDCWRVGMQALGLSGLR